ncbi:MAG: hypothetical protein ACKVP7_20225 [Hyphomicrobiaceae bacterium]
MQPALALLPPLAALVAVLGFRVSGLAAAVLSLVLSIGIWLAAPFVPPRPEHAWHALADAAVLSALVAAMIVPGILFVEATAKRRALEAISGVVAALQLSPTQAGLLVTVGLGVMVESLTGMGVSLLVTVPLLLRLVDRRRAIGLGLVGMSLMPWGALSISAHLGAKLSGVPMPELTAWISRISGPVAFSLPLLALLFLPAVRVADVALAIMAGLALVAGIAISAALAGIEIAGVIGGLAAIVVLALFSRTHRGLGTALKAPGLAPYAALIAAVIAQKLAVAPLLALGWSPALSTGRVSFQILTSPGVALLAATLITSASAIDGPLLRRVVVRAWRPVLSIACFMLAARFTIECGAIAALVKVLTGLGLWPALFAVVALGAVGGFATGSGVTGNALFMPSAAAAGDSMGHMAIFSALQNGASGHVAMAALPVAAILLSALPDRSPEDDRTVMRLGLCLAASHLIVLALSGAVWIWLGSR